MASPAQLIIAALLGFAVLLVLIIKFKIHALVAILISAGIIGFGSGLEPARVLEAYTTGMTNTLGNLALLVGLGSMLGAMLEHSGGTTVLANKLVGIFGDKYAIVAVGITSLLIGIPVFWDAAFVILLPIALSIARRTKQNALPYVLAVSSGVGLGQIIPPTPLPMLVCGLLGIDLADFVPIALLVAIPLFVINILIVPNLLAKWTYITPPDLDPSMELPKAPGKKDVRVSSVLIVIFAPIFLIMLNTVTSIMEPTSAAMQTVQSICGFIGTPFVALTVANVIGILLLGVLEGTSLADMEKIMGKGLEPVATIVLVTAGGGVFRYMLEYSGMSDLIGAFISRINMPIFVAALIIGIIFRVSVGSQTVALTMAGGIIGSLPQMASMSTAYMVLLAITLSQTSGAFSHVNDSGFWLYKGLLKIDVKTTFKTWTLNSGCNGLAAFIVCGIASLFV